jgi:hypothetical protein
MINDEGSERKVFHSVAHALRTKALCCGCATLRLRYSNYPWTEQNSNQFLLPAAYFNTECYNKASFADTYHYLILVLQQNVSLESPA